MQKTKVLLIAISILLIFSLSGSIKMNLKYDIGKDGKGNVEITIDMKKFVELAKSQENQQGSFQDFEKYKKENICKTIKEQSKESSQSQNQNLPAKIKLDTTEAECTAIEDYVVKLSWKNVDFSNSFTVDEQANPKKYKFTLKAENTDNKTQKENTPGLTPEQLKLTGMEMNLTIKMPGKITSANAGKISEDGKSVLIDFIQEEQKLKSDVEIISEETGFDLGSILNINFGGFDTNFAIVITLSIIAIGIILIPILGMLILKIIKK